MSCLFERRPKIGGDIFSHIQKANSHLGFKKKFWRLNKATNWQKRQKSECWESHIGFCLESLIEEEEESVELVETLLPVGVTERVRLFRCPGILVGERPKIYSCSLAARACRGSTPVHSSCTMTKKKQTS
jgi:hypothetical protein